MSAQSQYKSLQELAALSALDDSNRMMVLLDPGAGASQGTTDTLGSVDFPEFKQFVLGDTTERLDDLEAKPGNGAFAVPVTMTLTGAVSGSVAFDGSASFSLITSMGPNAIGISSVTNLASTLQDLQDQLNATSDFALNNTVFSAGDGLLGGGTLASNRSFSLGVPSSVGNGSTNAVTATSHTHALALVAGDIPNLDAGKIASGTLAVARAWALTGVVTAEAGTATTAIANNALSIAMTNGLQGALDAKATFSNPRLSSNIPIGYDVADTVASRAVGPGVGDVSGSVGAGGTWLFGAGTSNWGYIKGYYTNGSGNGVGKLVFGTRTAASDASITNKLIIHENGDVNVTVGSLTVADSFTLDCASSTDVFVVNNPGSSPAGSMIQFSSPGGIPGIIGNNAGLYRTDLKFNAGGSFSIAVSSGAGGAGDQFSFTSAGAFTATGAVNAASFGGAGVSQAASGSTLVQRTAPGYIFSNYINTTANDIGAAALSHLAVQQNNDGYHRWMTPANFIAQQGIVQQGGVASFSRAFAGYDAGAPNSFSCSGWFRASGQSGLYCADYAGGLYMTDATYLRSYNNKPMVASDFVISSDSRLKTGVRPLVYKGRLRPVLYTMIETGHDELGFIAQEVKELYPETVGILPETGYLQLSYNRLTAVLSAQLNLLEDDHLVTKQEVARLTAEVAALWDIVNTLKAA